MTVDEVKEYIDNKLNKQNIKYNIGNFKETINLRLYLDNYEIYEDINIMVLDTYMHIGLIPNNLYKLKRISTFHLDIETNIWECKTNLAIVKDFCGNIVIESKIYSINELETALKNVIETLNKLKNLEREAILKYGGH